MQAQRIETFNKEQVRTKQMVARLNALDNVDFRPGVAATRLFTRSGAARVTLSCGATIQAKLVVGADGRHSMIREAAGIGVKTRRYGQKALAFAVTHSIPHDNVSTEVHRTGGPFTLVPLPDHNGLPCSAVVWMDDGPKTQARMAADTATLEAEATERSCSLFGPLTLASNRTLWPIISQQAERLTAQRVALMAEAAHVMPPIGAQGLNMSLGDMRVLLELAEANPGDLGRAQMLEAYHRRRHLEVRARIAGIDMLNRASMLAPRPLRDLRAMGLDAIYSLAPVRRTMMQLGLGARG